MRYDGQGRVIYDLVCPAEQFAQELMRYCDWFSGVPDSVFRKVIANVSPYLFSPRENHAIGAAFGAAIVNKKPCVLMQNSGLGLSLDAITGLFRLYDKGLLLVISNRGELNWEEIQHQEWGRITSSLLDVCGYRVFDLEMEGLDVIGRAAEAAYCHNEISVILVHRGNIDE